MTPDTKTGRPTSPPRKSRATDVVAKAWTGTGEHPFWEFVLGVIGTATFCSQVFVLIWHPTTDKADLIKHAVIGTIALALMPIAGGKIAKFLKTVGPAAASLIPWLKKKDGGA